MSLIITISFGTSVFASPLNAQPQSCNIREYLYSQTLKKFQPLKGCVKNNSNRYNIPEWVLLVVLKQENGPMNGFLKNNDGTKDYGVTCINDKRFIDLKNEGYGYVTPTLVMENPCVAVTVMAYLLKKEYVKEKNLTGKTPRWLTVIANYHYNYRGTYPKRHDKYKHEVKEKLQLFAQIVSGCDTIK
jgi:hypothetical protein